MIALLGTSWLKVRFRAAASFAEKGFQAHMRNSQTL